MSFASEMMTGLRRRRAARAKFRQTLEELSAMSKRDLDDIGISRGQIGDIAREAARMV